MKKMYHFLCAMLLLSQVLVAQKDNISDAETIKYINDKLKGSYLLKNKKGELTIEVYKNGKVNRTDIVPFESLNPENVEYLPDEKGVVVRCISEECIDRKILVPKTRGQFSRISFVGEFDAKTQKGLVNAFEHLIRLFHDKKYKSTKPFED